MAEANVDALKRGYAALNRGDLSVVRELLDTETVEAGKAVHWEAVANPEEALAANR
jgi:ketosteroid isomerase-like protein